MDSVKSSSNLERLSPDDPEMEDRQASKMDIHDSQIRETKRRIGDFMYESGLNHNAVNLPSFKRMINTFSRGMSFSIPSFQELKGWIFDEALQRMHAYVNGVRKSWEVSGCSILLDQWTDAMDRDLANVLVDCPKGTVYLSSYNISVLRNNVDSMCSFLMNIVEEVGKDNVVQIISTSTSTFMKEVSQRLAEKQRKLFVTMSASSCIGLMLENLKQLQVVNETLKEAENITTLINNNPRVFNCLLNNSHHLVTKPLVLDAAHPFQTLETIFLQKESLKKVLLSSDIVEVESVADLVSDESFWMKVSSVLSAAIPLVRLLEYMNESPHPHMGYIYETMDRVKETIKEELKHKKIKYTQVWEVIDGVWEEFLHNPLHSAGFFLNPFLFYANNQRIDPEIATGMLCCVVRSTEDTRVQDKITVEMERYRTAMGAFKAGMDICQASNMSPGDWWNEFGKECPVLQRLAVRILNQTCEGGSRFELDRGSMERLASAVKNPTEVKRLTDMIFIQYNMKLQNLCSGDAVTSLFDQL